MTRRTAADPAANGEADPSVFLRGPLAPPDAAAADPAGPVRRGPPAAGPR